MGLLGTLVGGITSLFGGFQQNANIDKQIAAQQQAQQTAAQYNKELAKYQNDLNMNMWQKVANYNSPANQRKLLTEAGLNPDLMYGNGSSSFSAPNAPNMTSGAPVSPVDMSALGSKKTAGQIAADVFALKNIDAQTRKTEQDTKKTGEETKILSADALTRLAQNEQAIQMSASQVYLNHAAARLSHSQAERVASEITKLNEECLNLQEQRNVFLAQIKDIDMSVIQKQFDMFMRSKEFDNIVAKTAAEIRKYDSESSLNRRQLKEMMGTYLSRLGNLRWEGENLRSQHRILGITEDTISFNLDYAKDYQLIMDGAGAAGAILNGLANALGSVANFKRGAPSYTTNNYNTVRTN